MKAEGRVETSLKVTRVRRGSVTIVDENGNETRLRTGGELKLVLDFDVKGPSTTSMKARPA